MLLQKINLLICFTIIYLNCSSNHTEIQEINSNKIIEGFAGYPDNPKEKPFDYFYTKVTGRASIEALKKRNPELIKSFCIKSAINPKHVSKIIIEEVFYGATCGDGSVEEKTINSFAKKFKKELSELNLINCNPLHENDSRNSGWKECECIAYIKILGGRKTVVLWGEEHKK